MTEPRLYSDARLVELIDYVQLVIQELDETHPLSVEAQRILAQDRILREQMARDGTAAEPKVSHPCDWDPGAPAARRDR